MYGLASSVLRRPRGRPTASQRQVTWHFWRQVYVFHREAQERAELAEMLRELERQDLRDLPLFALILPFDLWRAHRKRNGERRQVLADDAFPYAEYFLHDFHHQANGGLSRRSAATYEWQIRFLFAGTNRLMRQRIVEALPAGGGLQVLDLGCGAAAWLPQARLQGREHAVTGIDLSPHDLNQARSRGDRNATFTQMNAEELPASWRERFYRILCLWTYHELPPEAQRRVTASMAHALKTGGEVLFMDVIQEADVPGLDSRFMNEHFAADFDEPHFADYQRIDLPAHFRAAGLEVKSRGTVLVSNFYRLVKAPSGARRAP